MVITNYKSFIYTHIPKCAGTSFRSYLYQIALDSNIPLHKMHIPGTGELSFDKNLEQLSEKELVNLREEHLTVLANHSKYEEHKSYGINLEEPFYYTILREPIARFISHYNFFYFKHGNETFKNKPLTALPEKELTRILEQLANIQTLYLANITLNKAFGLDNVLKVAKYNLQYEYAAFGLLEQLEPSMNWLKDQMPEWLNIDSSDIPKKNLNKDSISELPPKYLKMIEEYNWMDVELYQFATTLFKKLF